eukprot:4929273-Heterocapsa_arctica.AAC.1
MLRAVDGAMRLAAELAHMQPLCRTHGRAAVFVTAPVEAEGLAGPARSEAAVRELGVVLALAAAVLAAVPAAA